MGYSRSVSPTDFELEVNESSAYVDKLTTFVNDLRTAVKKVNPNGHVTADVAWSPNHIDGRWYNYTGISLCVDVWVYVCVSV